MPHRIKPRPHPDIERKHYEKQWYSTPDSPPFFMERFTINKDHPNVAEIFSGLEIDLVLSGTGTLYFDGKKYPMVTGGACFYDCTIPHAYSIDTNTPMVVLGLHILVDPVLQLSFKKGDLRLYEPFLAQRHGFSPILTESLVFHTIINNAFSHYEKRGPDWDMCVWSCIISTLIELRRQFAHAADSKFTEVKSNQNEVVVKAIQFINANCQNPLNLKEIARHCCCSTSLLSHAFSRAMNSSPIDYRNRLRIVRSLSMITQTHTGLNQIALECGFSSFSQFYDLFKRITGRTPASLR